MLQRAETIRQSQAIDIRARDVLISNLHKTVAKIREIEIFIPCAACMYFSQPEGQLAQCGISKDGKTPTIPEEIQIFGCGKGQEDDIPF